MDTTTHPIIRAYVYGRSSTLGAIVIPDDIPGITIAPRVVMCDAKFVHTAVEQGCTTVILDAHGNVKAVC